MSDYIASINTLVKSLQNKHLGVILATSGNVANSTFINLDHVDCATTKEIHRHGYSGYIVNVQKDKEVFIQQKMSLRTLAQSRYSVEAGDIIKDFAKESFSWILDNEVAGWNIDSVSYFPIIRHFFQNLSINPRRYISSDTYISFTFIAKPDPYRLSRMKNCDLKIFFSGKPSHDDIVDYYFDQFEECLNDFEDSCHRNKIIRLKPYQVSDELSKEVVSVDIRQKVTLVIYGKYNEGGYMMGTFYVRLHHPLDCHHEVGFINEDIEEDYDLESDYPTGEIDRDDRCITFRGCTFGATPDDCDVDFDIDFPEVPERFRDVAPVLYYIFYRLCTEDTSIENDINGKQIPFPLTNIPFDVERARIILHKLMQSMKSPWAVVVMWVETFLYGSLCFYGTRNNGCRATGIPGFQSKGLKYVNELVRRYVQESEDRVYAQIFEMYESTETVIMNLSLQCKTDSDLKTGVSRNALNMSYEKIDTLASAFKKVGDSGNTVVVFPTNKTGIEFIKHNLDIAGISNAVILWDEHDEMLSSYNKNTTQTERALYEFDDIGIVNEKKVILKNGNKRKMTGDHYEDTDDDDDVDDNYQTFAELEEAMQNAVKDCRRSYYISATISPIIWSSHDSYGFYVVSMEPSFNYIGHDTPLHCLNKVEHIPVPTHGKKPKGDFDENMFLDYESHFLDLLLNDWDQKNHQHNAALMVTQKTTNPICRQEVGASAIMSHSISQMKPLIVVLNNGTFTRLCLSDHFERENIFEYSLAQDFKDEMAMIGLRVEVGDFFQLSESDSDCDHVGVPNTLKIIDRDGIVYGRKHPSVCMELCTFLFSRLVGKPKARIIFLETLAMAAREKSYVNFRRSFYLQSLYLNFQATSLTNMPQLAQAFGRNNGVCTSSCEDKVRITYAPQKLYDDFIAYMRRQRQYVSLFQKHPGKSITEIDHEVEGGSEWDAIIRSIHEYRIGEAKRKHQIEINEMLPKLRASGRVSSNRGQPSDQKEAVALFLETYGLPCTIPEIVQHLKSNDLIYDLSKKVTINGNRISRATPQHYITTNFDGSQIARSLRRDRKRESRLCYVQKPGTKLDYVGLKSWNEDKWRSVIPTYSEGSQLQQLNAQEKSLHLLLQRDDMRGCYHSGEEILLKLKALNLFKIVKDRNNSISSAEVFTTTQGRGNFVSRITTILGRLSNADPQVKKDKRKVHGRNICVRYGYMTL